MTKYLPGGNEQLAVYRDSSCPTFVAQEFREMVDRMPELTTHLPNLHRYLLEFPNVTLPGATSFVYWQVTEFGLKPTIRISHLTIREGPEDTVVASKMLYASHYFWTGLEIRALVPDPARKTGSGSSREPLQIRRTRWIHQEVRSETRSPGGAAGRVSRPEDDQTNARTRCPRMTARRPYVACAVRGLPSHTKSDALGCCRSLRQLPGHIAIAELWQFTERPQSKRFTLEWHCNVKSRLSAGFEDSRQFLSMRVDQTLR